MAEYYGTPGDDDLTSVDTDANDNIYGLGGNDVLKGGGGLDNLFGGEGNDVFQGAISFTSFAYAVAYGEGGDDSFDLTGNTYIGIDGGTGRDKLAITGLA